MFFFLAACNQAPQNSAPPPQLSEHYSECLGYFGEPAFSYCIYTKAYDLKTKDDVESICPLTGDWEPDCRFSWASSRLQESMRMNNRNAVDKYDQAINKARFAEIIEICNGHEQCYSDLVDRFPSKDVFIQLDRCKNYAQNSYTNCANYALQKWSNSHPTEEEVTRIFNQITELPICSYHYISKIAYCDNYNTCEGNTAEHKKCRSLQEQLKKNPRPCHEWTGCTCSPQGVFKCATQGWQENNRRHNHIPLNNGPRR